MPIELSYDAEKHVFFITASGVLSEKDGKDFAKRLTRHPSFDPEARTFHDYTRVTEYKLSADFLYSLGQQIKSLGVAANRAWLVDSPIGMGTAMYYTKGLASPRTFLFYDRTKALACLNEGLPPEMHVH